MIKNKLRKNKHVSFSKNTRSITYNPSSSIVDFSYLNKSSLGNLGKTFKNNEQNLIFPSSATTQALNAPKSTVDTEVRSARTLMPTVDTVFSPIDPSLYPLEIQSAQSLIKNNTPLSYAIEKIPSSIKLSDNLSNSITQMLQTPAKDNLSANNSAAKNVNIAQSDEEFNEEELYPRTLKKIYDAIKLISQKLPTDDDKLRNIFNLLDNIEKSRISSEKRTMLEELKTKLLNLSDTTLFNSQNLNSCDPTSYIMYACYLIELKINDYKKAEKLLPFQQTITDLGLCFKSLINQYMYIDSFTSLSAEKIKLLKDKNILRLKAYLDLYKEFKPSYDKLSEIDDNIELCKNIYIKLANISDLLEDLFTSYSSNTVESLRDYIYKLQHHRKLLHSCMSTECYKSCLLHTVPDSELSKYKGSSVDAKYPLNLLLDEIRSPDFHTAVPIDEEIFKKTYNKYLHAVYRESYLIKKLLITVSEIDSILTQN